MIDRIFALVQGNAASVVPTNPAIHQKDWEGVINEASSSIIDGIKNYLECGKFNDLLNFFQESSVQQSPLVNAISNKFVNRLGKFYNINTVDAHKIAASLIPLTLFDLVKEANSPENEEFNVISILSYINGSHVNFYEVAKRMTA